MTLLEPLIKSLIAIHKTGIIHRDISPDNIILTEQGAKLLDFGTARETDIEKGHTVYVKPGYAPAEQYDSTGCQGPWSDVYSLSVVLYECITGRMPQDSLKRLFDDNIVPPSAFGVQLKPEQEFALMKGLALHKEERYQTVKDLAYGLGMALDSETTGTAPQKSSRIVQPKDKNQEPDHRMITDDQEKIDVIEKTSIQQKKEILHSKKEQRKNSKKKPARKILITVAGIALLAIVCLAALRSNMTVTINGKEYKSLFKN